VQRRRSPPSAASPESEPHRERGGALDHVIIGDDMSGLVPDEAGPGLYLRLLPARGRNLGTAADNLHDRGRHALEQRNGGPLIVGEIAASSIARGLVAA